MVYELKNCRTGEKGEYPTFVEITEKNGEITFVFTCEHSAFYCPCPGYNGIHSKGDACEILIGSDPERKVYYEIEISPKNELMIAEMTYCGTDPERENKPILQKNFQEKCFVKSKVTLYKDGYIAEVKFNKKDILSGDGEIFFNAYRLETDGEYKSKHLFALNPTFGLFHKPEYYLPFKDYVNK